MTKTFKSISVVLVFVMLLSTLSTTAFIVNAEENKTTDTGLVYVVSDSNTINIIGYTGNKEEVVVPEKIENKFVTKISSQAFNACENLTNIFIHSKVKSIEANTFYKLPKLKKVFYKSYSDVNVIVNEKAFNSCSKLETIVLPHGVITIPQETIFVCPRLKSLFIPQTCNDISPLFFSIYNKHALEAKSEKPVIDKGDINSDDIEKIEIDYTLFSFKNDYVKNFAKQIERTYVDLGAQFIPKSNMSIKAGRVYTPVTPKMTLYKGLFSFGYASANKKVAEIYKNEVVGLNKGSAIVTTTITPKYYPIYKANYKTTVKVTTAPAFSINKKIISVKKGKTTTINLTGKASIKKNVYYNTKYAKFISSTSATTLKIKGLKKGTTILKVKVNGVKTLSIKVRVI